MSTESPSRATFLLGMGLAVGSLACSSEGAATTGGTGAAMASGSSSGARLSASAAPPTATAADSPPPARGTVAPAEVPPPGFRPIPLKRAQGFPGVEFAEVRAVVMDLEVSGEPVCTLPLDEDGTPCSTVEAPGVTLTAPQSKRLIELLRSPATFGGGSGCYFPHHAFVFYDAAGTPVAQLAVCLMCDMVKSRPHVPASKVDTKYSYGISTAGTEALRSLCKELGLPKCDAKHPGDFGPGKK